MRIPQYKNTRKLTRIFPLKPEEEKIMKSFVAGAYNSSSHPPKNPFHPLLKG